ncbi:MAG: DUF2326 domain-containing protein [Calditrichaeota bacterium]|nr:DUF2326 domain-containing protein [Calditrichota bacterium]MCB9369934.1 DUF2326 domain-containing protein [Calditrichota bacterium]
MKLSSIYSNYPDEFSTVKFEPGLNVILGEIRFPQNIEKDSHNLGKSILGKIIDFCLLSKSTKEHFLQKRIAVFSKFEFLLEIELRKNDFLTIKRGVSDPNRISIKYHDTRWQDFSKLEDDEWSHSLLPFDKAKDIVDGKLDLHGLRPWSFRKIVPFLIRSQDDYDQIFQVKKFAGPHSDWKPFIAHILGFPYENVVELYSTEDEKEAKSQEESTIRKEVGGTVEDISKIDGTLLVKRSAFDRKRIQLDEFDFRKFDQEKIKLVAEQLDSQIAQLNSERYSLNAARRRVKEVLTDETILFDPKRAESLFAEANVLFPDQLKKDFVQLLEFNRKITEERRKYLNDELAEIEEGVSRIGKEINALGVKRKNALKFLGGSDVIEKFKSISQEMSNLQADIISLERRRESLARLQSLRAELRSLNNKIEQLKEAVENDVLNAESNDTFRNIRLFFNDIVESVIGRKAVLSVSPNRDGHLEFKYDLLDVQENLTSQGDGFTYRKFLCIAADLAILRAHIDSAFPHFVFHDGVFDALDPRKRISLMRVIRSYCDLGLQHIVTLIDSDIPAVPESDVSFFSDSEVVLRLHDNGDQGRLFKMPMW